ncbi:serine hydrolase [Sesbania bispinosa]|nr:serine hydrolase [Sesbania bispinosa]
MSGDTLNNPFHPEGKGGSPCEKRKEITTEIGDLNRSDARYTVTKLKQLSFLFTSNGFSVMLDHTYIEELPGKVAAFLFGSNFDHVAPTPRKSINGGGIASGVSLVRASSLCSATDDSEGSLANICDVGAVEFEKL